MINQMAASLSWRSWNASFHQTDGIPHRWVVGSTAIVLGDRWQSVMWHDESAKHHRVQAAAEYCGGIEMWADDVLLHLHQVGTQLDIFAESRASACTYKRSVLKKEMASVHLTEGLANMASEQELWTSYPLGAQEARAHAFHADSALRYTLSLRPFARCVAADWLLRGTNSTTGASRNWHIRRQQSWCRPLQTVRPRPRAAAASSRPDGTNSESLQWSASPDDLFSKQLESNEAQTRGTRPTGTGPLLPPSARGALDWDPSRSPFQVHIVKFRQRLSASVSAESSTPTRHEPLPAARCGPAPATSTSATMTSCVAQPLARPWQSLSRAQTTSEVASGKLEYGAGAFFAFDTTLGHSKDGNKHAARKAGRCASARGAPSQRGAGRLGAGGQHLNSQSRQSVAGAAAGGGMDLGMCVSTPARLSLADMATCTKWSPEPGKTAPACERALLLGSSRA